MSGLSDASGQDAAVPSIDTQQLQDPNGNPQQSLQNVAPPTPAASESGRKAKAPSVRRACLACHQGKTRCSEVLPCQSCLKRGLGATCAYPDPDHQDHGQGQAPPVAFAPMGYPPMHPPTFAQQQYYDYNGALTGASTSTFRPNKRPRPLTEEETAAITRNFSRGDFYVGNSAPVRIDPRLPVRLTLGEGDHVHFTVGESMVYNGAGM
ncbi:hypothetical protein JAAARDRAFT_29177 [Jaapia argillacea MUCL 33604]|uniref:Zn(2)-C6 fungal-type domain-containing protein n=1 Tax=Jaapia argillacea MUCL 33604 TaxID=933084 RepID=A0A067Q869_9AGAM|nr:hypothetical protein JAAARDRAFT_29177 [Jaapia argillacea MUCL 33604]